MTSPRRPPRTAVARAESRTAASGPAAVFAAAALVCLSGCLGEPPIEERWTLLEVLEAQPSEAAAFAAGPTPVIVRARITYREVLTGFVVAEVRESDMLTADDTGFEAEDRWLDVARDVDLVLANSTSLGHETVAVTGFDHLIQKLTLRFDAAPPAGTGGLFLVLYFSEDVEEVELPGGGEMEVITPVFSTERDILSTGIELSPSLQE